MKEEFSHILKENGVDVEHSIERFVGDSDLYEMFLKKFPNDNNYQQLEKSLSEKNYEDALKYSHALKGLTGNLGINIMFQALTQMVADLRSGKTDNLTELFQTIQENYKTICRILGE